MENKDTEKILTILNSSDASIATNIDQSYIFTTEDKVRILYDEYNRIRKQSSDTLSWLGIFLTLLITDFTCDFKTIWFLSSDLLKAIFIVATVLFFCLFCYSAKCWYTNKEKMDYPYFLEKLKGERDSLFDDKER